MRIAWLTDIHLNFLDEKGLDAWCEAISTSGCDAVLLTGDISEAPTLEAHLQRVAAPFFFPFFFILGNHDFYRGSVAEVRATAARLTKTCRNLKWLPELGVVSLGKTTALVGHDGWADGRAGDWEGSEVFLNDYVLISDLVTSDKTERRARMERFAREGADYLEKAATEAAKSFSHVIVATHVPPWEGACWHKGKVSNASWLPHFTSITVGEAIARVADAHPNARFTVLCGHTHSPGVVEVRPNLVCRTGPADYGNVVAPELLEI
jgi:predicted phosphohydrolase